MWPQPDNAIRVHNPSINNLVLGLQERCLGQTVNGVWTRLIPPDEQTVRGALAMSIASFGRHTHRIAKMKPHQFINCTNKEKRYLYMQALVDLERHPITSDDARISPFTKLEKIDFLAKDDPAPRLIQPRAGSRRLPRFSVATGLFIRPIERKLFGWIDKWFINGRAGGLPTVFKGLNSLQRGSLLRSKWCRFSDPVAIAFDASRFDMHVNYGLFLVEWMVYLSLFDPHEASELKELCSWLRNGPGSAKMDEGVVQFIVGCMRGSGDMNTSLGNVLLMCLMIHAYLVACRPGSEPGDWCEVGDDGDDWFLICERGDAAALLPGAWFTRCGMDMKVEPPVDILEELEFCQTHCVFDGEVWRMVRSPLTIAKDLVCVRNRPIPELKKWAAAVGECGLAVAGNMPIFGSFYRKMRQSAKDPLKRGHADVGYGMQELGRGQDSRYAKPHDDCRISFCRAFGILPDIQEQLERLYDDFVPLWVEVPEGQVVGGLPRAIFGGHDDRYVVPLGYGRRHGDVRPGVVNWDVPLDYRRHTNLPINDIPLHYLGTTTRRINQDNATRNSMQWLDNDMNGYVPPAPILHVRPIPPPPRHLYIDHGLCPVCMDDGVPLFDVCGHHHGFCWACIQLLDPQICPLCRRPFGPPPVQPILRLQPQGPANQLNPVVLGLRDREERLLWDYGPEELVYLGDAASGMQQDRPGGY